jgi:hypothetical protein
MTGDQSTGVLEARQARGEDAEDARTATRQFPSAESVLVAAPIEEKRITPEASTK